MSDQELSELAEYDAEIERTFKITVEEIETSRNIDYWVLGLTPAQKRQKVHQLKKNQGKKKNKDRSEYYRQYYQNKKGVAV